MSFTVENLFTIKLEVLSSVVYGWRNLEMTVRIRLKTRGRRLNPKLESTRKLLTPGTLIDKSSSKSPHTYTETKLHPRANEFHRKTYHAISPAMQEHSPELQYTGCPKSRNTHDTSKLTTGHLIALQREEAQLHPPEHRYKLL